MRACVVVVMVWSSSVMARPLPKGLTVTFKGETLYASQDGITVPLLEESRALADVIGDFKNAELSEDGAQIVVHAQSCLAGDEGLTVPLASVTARLANARGMQVHVKKKYADAIVQFAAAAHADADTPVYATNLLSAQSMAKLYDDADKTIATYAAAHAAWFGWRLAVDPELANVRARASAKPYVAAKPSKLTVEALGDAIAVSPTGLVALREWTFDGGPGAPDNSFDLAIYDPTKDVLPVRLTAVPLEQACGGMGGDCTKAQLAKQAASMRKLDPVVAGLGFEKRATTWADAIGNDGKPIVSPDKRTTVTLDSSGSAVVTRGGKTTKVSIDGHLTGIGFAGDLVVVRMREGGYIKCDGDAQRSYSKIVQLK